MLEQNHHKHGGSASSTSTLKKRNQNPKEARNISENYKPDLTVENRQK